MNKQIRCVASWLMIALHAHHVDGMSSSTRRMLIPALQTGIKSLESSTPKNISFASGVYVPTMQKNNNLFPSGPGYHKQDHHHNTGGTFSSKPLVAGMLAAGLLAADLKDQYLAYSDASDTNLSDNGERKFAQKYPNLYQFVQKHSCPYDVEIKSKFYQSALHEIDRREHGSFYDKYVVAKQYNNNPALQRAGLLNSRAHGQNKFQYGSGDIFSKNPQNFYIKQSQIDRIINAEKLQNYFKNNNLDNRFAVAQECLRYDGNAITVISYEIEKGDQTQKVSLQELQGIVKIAFATNYWDWQFGNNIIRNKEGKLVFVDTEEASFSYYSWIPLKKQLYWLYLDNNKNNFLDPAAQQWLTDKLDRYTLEKSDPLLLKKQVTFSDTPWSFFDNSYWVTNNLDTACHVLLDDYSNDENNIINEFRAYSKEQAYKEEDRLRQLQQLKEEKAIKNKLQAIEDEMSELD